MSDAEGNKTTAIRKVTIVDTTSPVIKLAGEALVTHEAGSSYADLGATANDLVDGDLSGNLEVESTVNIGKPGVYTVSYGVSDAVGNKAKAVVRKVSVVDTTGPVVTLNGGEVVTHEAGGLYKDGGASAADVVDGTVSVQTSGDVNSNKPGSYTLVYSAVDSLGNVSAKKERTVTVRDTTGPVIKSKGDLTVIHEAGSSYKDSGASAVDVVDGDLSGDVKVVSTVDISKEGSYSVTYSVSDAAGNAAAEVVRAVTVKDTTAPVITLLGQSVVAVEVGQAYLDSGASAVDVVDGDLKVKMEGEVDVSKVGEYRLRYNVSDSAGNDALEVIRTVVVGDTGRPVITLKGKAREVIEAGSSYTDAGASAADMGDGELSGLIKMVGGVDTGKVGVYELFYSVKDSQGNAATQVTRRVEVRDTKGPVINLKGEVSVTHEAGSSYKDAGASAVDVVDGDLSLEIDIVSTVNTQKPGVYRVSYGVSDVAGNKANAVVRTVKVEDTTGPVITLNGDEIVDHEAGGS